MNIVFYRQTKMANRRLTRIFNDILSLSQKLDYCQR